MRLLVDSDAFCKLAASDLLSDAAMLFDAELPDCGRLPALPYMLRRGGLPRDEFEADNLSSSLLAFMTRHYIGLEDTDLIVDLGPVAHMVTEGVARFATQFLGDVPGPNRWRTLTLSASAFPKSMGVVDRHSHAVVDRAEWLAWERLRDRGQLIRVPHV